MTPEFLSNTRSCFSVCPAYLHRSNIRNEHGCPQKFFQGGESRNFASAYPFGLLTMQRKLTYTKRFTLSTPQKNA